ncbi:Protein C04F6.7 [Aphelenchoides avenae]|nr:Protein C04F6.7 [Aphelenchus avenae]
MTVDVAVEEIVTGDPNSQLAECGFTIGWFVETLLKCNPEFKEALGSGKVQDITALDISDGEGYVSRVYKVTMKLVKAKVDEYSVIMKVPTGAKLLKLAQDVTEGAKDGAAEGMKEFWDKLDYRVMHDVECAFYEAVSEVEGFPLPKVWYTRCTSNDAAGVILMEDLSAVACKTGFTQTMTAQQLRNITRHFAALHAYHLCASDELLKKIGTIPQKSKFLSESSEGMFESMIAGVPEAHEGALADLVKKLKPTGSTEFIEYTMFKRPQELGIPPLLCQGDSGGHNMFFKKADDGTISNEVCAFLDWQVAFKGNPFYDIAKLVVCFSDADVRRDVEANLVEDYFEHLKKGVENKGGKKLGFRLEQLREAYELSKIQSSLMTVGFITFVAVSSKGKVSPGVLDAMREKGLLRAKFALADAVESLKKYAPQYLAD